MTRSPSFYPHLPLQSAPPDLFAPRYPFASDYERYQALPPRYFYPRPPNGRFVPDGHFDPVYKLVQHPLESGEETFYPVLADGYNVPPKNGSASFPRGHEQSHFLGVPMARKQSSEQFPMYRMPVEVEAGYPSDDKYLKHQDASLRSNGVPGKASTTTRLIPVIASDDAAEHHPVKVGKDHVLHHESIGKAPNTKQAKYSQHQGKETEENGTPEKKKPSVKGQLDEDSAAVCIQALFRGYSVRRSDPLKHLRMIAGTMTKARDLHLQIADPAVNRTLRMDKFERAKYVENIMALLLQIDSIQGVHPAIRERRKAAAKELVRMQEEVDSLSDEGSVPDSSLSKAKCEADTENEDSKTPFMSSQWCVGGNCVKPEERNSGVNVTSSETDADGVGVSEKETSQLNVVGNLEADVKPEERNSEVKTNADGVGISEESEFDCSSDMKDLDTSLDIDSGCRGGNGLQEQVTNREEGEGAKETIENNPSVAIPSDIVAKERCSAAEFHPTVEDEMETDNDGELLQNGLEYEERSTTRSCGRTARSKVEDEGPTVEAKRISGEDEITANVQLERPVWEKLLNENRELKDMLQKLAEYSYGQAAIISKVEERIRELEQAIQQQNTIHASRKGSKIRRRKSRKRGHSRS